MGSAFVAEVRRSPLLQALLAASPVGICILEPPVPTLAFGNPAMSTVFGMPVVPGTPFRDLVARLSPRTPDGAPIAFKELPGVRALAGESVVFFEMRVTTGTGGTAAVMCSSAPVTDETGRVAGAVDMFWEITATRELERSRSLLLAGISHDLRSPLAVIQMCAQQIEQGNVLPGAAARLKNSVRRLSTITNDLSAFALLDAKELRLRKEEFDLCDLLRAIAETTALSLPGRQLNLLVSEEPLRVVADPVRVEQIVVNLLTNADRYSPPGEPVELAAEGSPDAVQIRVSDRGPGISDEDKAAIFEPFRLGRQRHPESLGLGLHIARGIARAHGGDVVVVDRPSGGSVFVVTLARMLEGQGVPSLAAPSRTS